MNLPGRGAKNHVKDGNQTKLRIDENHVEDGNQRQTAARECFFLMFDGSKFVGLS